MTESQTLEDSMKQLETVAEDQKKKLWKTWKPIIKSIIDASPAVAYPHQTDKKNIKASGDDLVKATA